MFLFVILTPRLEIKWSNNKTPRDDTKWSTDEGEVWGRWGWGWGWPVDVGQHLEKCGGPA